MKIIGRLLLFPFLGLYEILLLAVMLMAILLVAISEKVDLYATRLSENMLDRSEKLPSFPWYIGK